jgi:hypothetical protein
MRYPGLCFAIAFLLAGASWGCGVSNRSELMAIDSLARELKKADSLLGKVDVERALRVTKGARAACETLQEKHPLYPIFRAVEAFEGPESDTLTPQETRIQNRRHQMAQQVLYTFGQLKNLRHDVQAGLVKGADFQTHLSSEKKAVAHLYDYVLGKQRDFIMRFHTYDSLQTLLHQPLP